MTEKIIYVLSVSHVLSEIIAGKDFGTYTAEGIKLTLCLLHRSSRFIPGVKKSQSNTSVCSDLMTRVSVRQYSLLIFSSLVSLLLRHSFLHFLSGHLSLVTSLSLSLTHTFIFLLS